MRTPTVAGRYFEEFTVGAVLRHARGKTVTDADGLLLTHLSMNTAQSHFNDHFMAGRSHGRRVVFGGVTCSIVLGLASQDVAYHALRELGMPCARFLAPVFYGDTLYAYTEILAVEPHDNRCGGVTLRHLGVNQDEKVVFDGQRQLLVRARP